MCIRDRHPCTARMHCTHALHAGTGRMHCAHALHACVCVRVCVESALWWLPERTTPTSRFFLPGGGGGHALLVRARATSVMRCTCAPRAPTCFPSAPRQTVLRCTRAPSAQPHFVALLLRSDGRAPRATQTRTPSATHPRGTPFSLQRAANAAPRGVLDHQECLGICLGKRYCAREHASPTGRARIRSGDMKKPCFSFGSGGVAASK